VLTMISISSGQNYLVVDQGNPDGYQTIHAAVTAASSGDTIFVTAGEYIFDAVNGQITISKRLTLIGAGYDADGTHLTDQTNGGFFILDGAADGSTVTGFKMKGAGTHISVQSGAKTILVERNLFVQTSDRGYAVVFSSTEDDTIRYNYFLSDADGSGLNVATTKGQVINNNFFIGTSTGLSVNGSDASDRVLVINNIFLQCGLYRSYTYYYALSVNSVAEIYSNAFMNNAYGVSASGNPIIKYNSFFNGGNEAGYFKITDDPFFCIKEYMNI